MKKLVTILLIGELLFAYFGLSPVCLLRRDVLHALNAWSRNPTPEARAELERQRRISEVYRVGFSIAAFGVMAAATLLIATGRKRPRTPNSEEVVG